MKKWTSIALALLLIVSVLIGWNMYFGLEKRNERKRENLDVCRIQLAQIYKDLKAFANDHEGRFPPKLSDLVLGGYEDQDIFVCPNSNDTYINRGTPTTQMANRMNGPDRGSYKYCGTGLTESSPPNSILVIEAPENHAPDGGHVVYLDGNIVFRNSEALKNALDSRNISP